MVRYIQVTDKEIKITFCNCWKYIRHLFYKRSRSLAYQVVQIHCHKVLLKFKICLAVFVSVTETEISINHPQALEVSGAE